MSTGNVVVSQDAPAKNNLWIQPKGTARFWNGSIWKAISGGGGGGGDLSNYYTKGQVDERLGNYIPLAGSNVITGNLTPNGSGINLGESTKRWEYIYANIVNTNGITNSNTIVSKYLTINDSYGDSYAIIKKIYLGDSVSSSVCLTYENNALHVSKGLYSDSFVSALGLNSSSGGGGGGGVGDLDWNALMTYDGDSTHIINSMYLPAAYLPLTGGVMTGPLQWESSAALPQATSINYFLGIDAFTSGGTTKWISAENTIKSLIGTSAIGTSTRPIYWSGSTFSTTTHTLNATIYSGTVNYLAYYSSIDGINADPHIRRDNNYLYIDYSTATASGFRLKNSLCDFMLHLAASGNRGIYESITASNWLLYWPNNEYTATLPKGGLTASGTITSSGGYLKSTYNSNTVTIGSQNSSWCHIYNSAAIPFIFNNTVACAGTCNDTSASLGTVNYPWHRLVLGGATNNVMTASTTNPRITFQENSGIQQVHLVYTDWDSYRSPAGLKVIGNGLSSGDYSSPAWFEVEGVCYCAGLSSSSYVTALATNSSDKRLKKNIKPFNATKIVDKLKPVQFEWNNEAKKYNENFKDGKNYGLIAQDSDNIIDDLVFDLPDGKGYKGVRYEKLIPILLQAIKELKQEINDLKNK